MNEGVSSSASTQSSPYSLSNESKSPTAFRTISEVAEGLALPQHVLRFWESKFQQIKPLKRGGGRRYYRPEDVKIIHDIKDLLYNQGFTIRGVQKLLRENGAASLSRAAINTPQIPSTLQTTAQQTEPALSAKKYAPPSTDLSPDKRREIEGLLAELKSIRKVLQQGGF
ncbi:MAG: MerR family transcriptional regulator [Alphaproteobacteria bacterium]|nr:MerR family transcriptional regulator [Alphaproteobacteria bacterium]